jgi:outer membrane receptor protein involved in Fe transport
MAETDPADQVRSGMRLATHRYIDAPDGIAENAPPEPLVRRAAVHPSMTEHTASRLYLPCVPGARRALRFALLWLAFLAAALPASAQQEAPKPEAPAQPTPDADAAEEEIPGEMPPLPSGVEVIYVQGETMQILEDEATSSVTQFDAEALKAIGAQNIGDLAKVTPNLEIKTAGATAPTFFIRGVGLSDFASNAAGAVAIYQDDVARNAPAIQLGTLFDVENVAVLRGPQGSGAGRNASAGAIKIYSRKPTGELEANLKSTFGNYGFQDYEGALESPLVGDMLSSRLAFRVSMRDPLATNRCDEPTDNIRTGFPTAGPNELNRRVPPLLDRINNSAPWNTVSICGENPTFQRFADNPQGPSFGNVGDPLQLPPGTQISILPGGLPGGVNDLGNWAARGTARLQPPETDFDFLFNLHGGRRDELSTLGQSVGDAVDIFGNSVGGVGGYRDRDIIAMQSEIEQERGLPPGTGLFDVRAQHELARKLAENLDKHPFRGDYNRVGDTRLTTWGSFADATWDPGGIKVRSITGYDTYDRFRDTDQDFSPEILFESVVTDEAWQISEDLQLSGEFSDSNVRWDAGGFFLTESLDNSQEQIARAPGVVNRAQKLLLDYKQDLVSWGAYAGFGWDFLTDFTLEGGARWNWEQKKFDYRLQPVNLAIASAIEDKEIWQAPTGTLTLTYRLRDDASLYWKYSRGWKGGHFNALPQLTLGTTVADPETIDAFETGVKAAWLDGRLNIAASLFYYDYQDYQVLVVQDSAVGPPGIAIINANDAEIYGAEVEARAEPFDALVLTTRFGWLESQFLDFTNQIVRFVIGTDGNTVPRVITVDYTGNQLINSPEFKVSGAVDYTIDMGRYGSLLPHYDFAWSADIFFDPTEGRGSPNFAGQLILPKYATGQRAYWLHNLRLGYRTPDGSIEIAGWVRNLTDFAYKSYAFDASIFGRDVVNYVGEPRTYGLDFLLHF